MRLIKNHSFTKPAPIVFIVLVATVGIYSLLHSFAATNSVTFSGKLSPKTPSQTKALAISASGTLTAQLTYSKISNVSLQLIDPNGIVVTSANGPSPINLSRPVSSGTYQLKVSGSGSGSYSVTATYPVPGDTTNPAIAVTQPTSGATISGTVTVSGTASDNVSLSKVEVSVDGGAFQSATGTTSWTYSLNTTTLTNASHTITVRAVDSSSNAATASVTATVSNTTADTTAPTISISSPATGATVGGTTTVSGTASDNVALAKVEVQIDSGTFQPATGTTSWTYNLDTLPLANGAHTITAKATDTAGLGKVSSISVTVSNTGSDTTAPTAPSQLNKQSGTTSSIYMSWNSATDNVGVKSYLLYRNGSLVATLPATTAFSQYYTDNGLFFATSYTYYVKAQDAAGNTSPASSSAILNTNDDTTPPTTPTNLKTTVVSSSRVDLSWTASSDDFKVADYIVYRNGIQVAGSAATSTFDSGMTPASTASYTVKARDVKQNLSAASAAATAVIPADNVPPKVTILSPASGATFGNSSTGTTFSASSLATDDAAVNNAGITLDGATCGGGAQATLSSNCYISNLANGPHTLTAWATDAAGNRGEASITVNIQNTTTDTVPPTVAVSSPASGSSVQGTITITGTASDNAGVKRVQFIVGNNSSDPSSGTATGTTNWSYQLDTTKLFNGTQTFMIQVTDINNIYNYIYLDLNINNPLSPSQSWVSPEGLKIQIASGAPYTTDYIYRKWQENSAAAGNVAEVASHTTIIVDPSHVSSAGISASSDGYGGWTGFGCSINVGNSTFRLDEEIAHEYGHCWTYYHYFINHRGQWDKYINSRWANGDGSVKYAQDARRETDTYCAWNCPFEVIAEDYRLLFGSPLAIAQIPHNGYNPYIPDPRYEPMKLKDWFLNTWAKPE